MTNDLGNCFFPGSIFTHSSTNRCNMCSGDFEGTAVGRFSSSAAQVIDARQHASRTAGRLIKLPFRGHLRDLISTQGMLSLWNRHGQVPGLVAHPYTHIKVADCSSLFYPRRQERIAPYEADSDYFFCDAQRWIESVYRGAVPTLHCLCVDRAAWDNHRGSLPVG